MAIIPASSLTLPGEQQSVRSLHRVNSQCNLDTKYHTEIAVLELISPLPTLFVLPSELLNKPPSRDRTRNAHNSEHIIRASKFDYTDRERIICEELRSEIFLRPCRGSPGSGDWTSGQNNLVQQDMARHYVCQLHEPTSEPKWFLHSVE